MQQTHNFIKSFKFKKTARNFGKWSTVYWTLAPHSLKDMFKFLNNTAKRVTGKSPTSFQILRFSSNSYQVIYLQNNLCHNKQTVRKHKK